MAISTPGDLTTDFEATTAGAGLLDRSDRGKIRVTGADAADFLQGQVTNDVEKLEPGSGCYAALLDPKAKMLADARVLRIASEEIQLDTEAVALDAALGDLRMYKIGRKVEIENTTGDRALLSLVGPGSADVVRRVAGDAELPDREYDFVAAEVVGAEVLIVNTALGMDLFCQFDTKPAVEAALISGGAIVVAPEAAEAVRIAHGIPVYGVDMTRENLPGEAGIVERAVSFEKGCYVGQEPVARMFHKGRPNRHLRGLRFTEPVAAGSVLASTERELGRVTSTADSPALGPIGLGILRREAQPGDELKVVGSGARATVIELPF